MVSLNSFHEDLSQTFPQHFHPGHANQKAHGYRHRSEVADPAEAHSRMAGEEDVLMPEDGVDGYMDYAKDQASVNLEHMQVEGSSNANLFREHTRDLKRGDMPQLPESPEGLAAYKEHLNTKGIKTKELSVDPRTLKATQNELDSRKTAQIHDYLKSHDGHLAKQSEVLVVSKERSLVDGHHRWAATCTYAIKHPGTKVLILESDADIDTLLRETRAFSSGIGQAPEAISAPLRHIYAEQGTHMASDASDWWYESWYRLRKQGMSVEEADAKMAPLLP